MGRFIGVDLHRNCFTVCLLAENGRESIDVFCRLASRSYGENVFWLAEDGNEVRLCNRVVDNAGAGFSHAQHASLMVLLKIVRDVAGSHWRPRHVRLQAPETKTLHRADGLQECHASFDQTETAVAFPRKLLAISLADHRRRVERDGAARIDLGDLPLEHDNFAQSLQRLLVSQFPFSRLPTLELAVNITGASRRTIKRRLFDEGLTYRGLLDRIRFDVARKMLGDANASISEIASELGYSGPNNFIRAFKRITGVTPTEYRENLADE